MVDGKRHGHWVFRYADGKVEEGPMVDGKMHGHWVFRYADGNVQEGPMVDGKLHGNWVMRYAKGMCLYVEFDADKMVAPLPKGWASPRVPCR